MGGGLLQFMRQVKLQDKKLFAILKDRGKAHKEIEKVNNEIVRLDKERKKLVYKMERIKDKTTNALKNHSIPLGEFEEIGIVGIEQGEITVSIYDNIEEYKKLLREEKDKK